MTTGTARVTQSFRAAAHALEAAHAAVLSRRGASAPAVGSDPGGLRRDGGPAQAGRFLWLDDPGRSPRR